ncbi:MAG: outer membrane lipoprotein-sorting protein [Acidobacteriota bacterium]
MNKLRPKQIMTMLAVAVVFTTMGESRPGLGDPRPQEREDARAASPPLQSPPPEPELSADSIIVRMVAANQRRDALLQRYSARQTYRAVNYRFKKKAELQAQVEFDSPATKCFAILSQKGSGTIRKRVFGRMMKAEQEALKQEMKRRSAINRDNYRFELVGEDDVEGRRCYLLEAEPKRKDKFLFRGRLWIDTVDFAVVKVKGRPAKRPSFWTRKIEFVRQYQKIGPFWLPAKLESVTHVFIFGKSRLTVEHSDYQVEVSTAGNQ